MIEMMVTAFILALGGASFKRLRRISRSTSARACARAPVGSEAEVVRASPSPHSSLSLLRVGKGGREGWREGVKGL